MKVAAIYTGRSMSQPVLLNEIHDVLDVDVHLFKDNKQDVEKLNFDPEFHSLDVADVEIHGRKALWATQHRLREKWRQFLTDHLDSDFDVVIGMNDLGTPAIDAANSYEISSLFFLRNLEVSGQEMCDPERSHVSNFISADFGAKVQYPYFVKNFNEYQRGMREADTVIANSEYVSRRLESDFGVESEVIYPPITLDDYKVDPDEDGYIAMVNPRNRDKGADIFFDVAESMPSEGFLAAGVFRDAALEARARNIPNLTHVGWCEDMRELYTRAKVVVVPSRWNEAFGRVAVEAMVSGIPCVVSGRGGLPEVVGDTGVIVEDIESTEAWQEAIEVAITEHDPEAQKARAQRFATQRQGKRLASIIENVVG